MVWLEAIGGEPRTHPQTTRKERSMKLEVSKVKAEDVKDERAILVCVPVGWEALAGSKTDECFDCGRQVLYSKTAPKVSRKVCVPCFLEGLKKMEAEDGTLDVRITDEQIEEVADHFKK
jgi:hypothetical protein